MDYATVIKQLKADREAVKKAADMRIAEIDNAIQSLRALSGEPPIKNSQRPMLGRSFKIPPTNQLAKFQQPTDEDLIVQALWALGGRSDVKGLFDWLERNGTHFNYDTASQLHGFSIGLSKKRHTYTRVGNEAGGWYFLKEEEKK
jgi:hypothetical protein